jgi:hypothetical protein
MTIAAYPARVALASFHLFRVGAASPPQLPEFAGAAAGE